MNGTGNTGCIGAISVPPESEKFRVGAAKNITAVSDIPTDPRLFQRWLTAQGCWTVWPIPLSNLATRAGWGLMARTAPDWMAPENRSNRDQHRANWSAFTTAYADHVGARS